MSQNTNLAFDSWKFNSFCSIHATFLTCMSLLRCLPWSIEHFSPSKIRTTTISHGLLSLNVPGHNMTVFMLLLSKSVSQSQNGYLKNQCTIIVPYYNYTYIIHTLGLPSVLELVFHNPTQVGEWHRTRWKQSITKDIIITPQPWKFFSKKPCRVEQIDMK